MTKTRGIVFIAFGQEYDRLAAHTIAFSRDYTTLPITVLTNLDNRDAKWAALKGVNFIRINETTDNNRRVKIDLHKYTPYEETLYMDVDAIIIRPGIERIFDYLNDKDIVFQHHATWDQGEKYARIYRDTMVQFGLQLPLHVYLGGFWAFRKSPATIAFFEQWMKNWIATGCGRDMPSLACTVKQTGIPCSSITRDRERLFSFGMNYDCAAIHRVAGADLKRYGIPEHKQNKPFDANFRGAWDRVAFDEPDTVDRGVFIVKNQNIDVHIAKGYGGTVRRVLFKGIDSGIRRAGCEFWSNTIDHYEQEYGELLAIKAIRGPDSMTINVKATLQSPQLRTKGGTCETIIEVTNDGRIVSKARLFPEKPVLNYDQYYCFNQETYTHYNFIGFDNEFKKIQPPKPGELWWWEVNRDSAHGINLKNGNINNAVSIYTDENLRSETGIYTSRNMMEVKCKNYRNERISEFCEMELRRT